MVDDGERDGSPDAESTEPHEPERQVGGSEWLLQQLSGGRLKSILDSPRRAPAAPEPGTPAQAVEPPAAPEVPLTADPEPSAAPDIPADASASEAADDPAAPPRRRAPAAPVGLWPGEPVQSETPPAEQTPEGTEPVEADAAAMQDLAAADPIPTRSPLPRTEAAAGPSGEPHDDPETPTADAEDDSAARRPGHASPTLPTLPETEPSADPPAAPDLRDPSEQPIDGRPAGATPPTPREPAAPAVYQWPDPRATWDEPPVWEEIVAPRDDPEDDGGDEELWRETADSYAWNLEPAVQPEKPAEAAPFRTAAAAEHVNSASSRAAQAPQGRRASAARTESGVRDADASTSGPWGWRTLSRRRLLLAIIAAAAVLLLAALFAIGVAVGSSSAPSESGGASLQQEAAPAAAPTVAETPAPTAAVPLPTAGPLPAGTWAWTELLGGECVQPFDSVWAEQFTVVDCGAGHEAQLVARAELPDTAFPGQEALAVSVSSLCQAQGVVDVAAAGAYGDVQVSGSFPVTQEQWDAGERSYYCFVDRAGGGELVGSLAATPAA